MDHKHWCGITDVACTCGAAQRADLIPRAKVRELIVRAARIVINETGMCAGHAPDDCAEAIADRLLAEHKP